MFHSFSTDMSEKTRKPKASHWLITGDDDYAIQQRAAVVMKENDPGDSMNVEVVSGHADSVDAALRQTAAAIEALQTLPFLGGKKLIHFKDVNFLADTVEGRSAAVQESIQKLVEVATSLSPDEAQLVISAIGIDKRRTFFKGWGKIGSVEVLEKPELKRPQDLAAWASEIEKRFQELGLEAGAGVAERLVDAAGDDTRRLQAEIEKLSLYCHPRTRVEESDVKAICHGTREMVVWDLCDAVAEGRTVEALRLLKALLHQNERPERLLIALEGQVRLAALGTFLLETGRLKLVQKGSFVDAQLSPGSEDLVASGKKGEKFSLFPLGKAARAGRRKPSAKWFPLVEIVHQAHLEMFSGGAGDREQLLESVVVKLTAA